MMRVNGGKIDRRAPDEVDGELCTGTANVEGLNYNTGNCLAELSLSCASRELGWRQTGVYSQRRNTKKRIPAYKEKTRCLTKWKRFLRKRDGRWQPKD